MAQNNTISIGYIVEGSDGLKKICADADALRKIMQGTVTQAEKMQKSLINFAALAKGLESVTMAFSRIQGTLQGFADAYAVQETAEKQLETVMRQRMKATDEEIQSIKELASAQQEIGVIGDEVQLSGAQQVATFLTEKRSLEVLIPAMNNLIAQQKGLNATNADAVSVGNLMGKAMQGQTSALRRVGITFTEAQEQVMKFGTESERAAMLAQIITDNVGNMNAELAKTDSGQQKQLNNTIGDIKESIGSLVKGALPFVTITAQSTAAINSIVTLGAAIKMLTVAIFKNGRAWAVATGAYIKNKVAAIALAGAQKVVKMVTVLWTAAQSALNAVLAANPIGIAVIALAALAGGIVYAYKHSEAFRNAVDKLWKGIKPLADSIMKGLAKSFEWLAEKCKAAWEWLKKVLGLAGKKAEVEVEVKDSGSSLSDLEKKYANAGKKDPKADKGTKTPKAAKAPKDEPVWTEEARSLKQLSDNVAILNKELDTCTDPSRQAEINRQIEAFEKQAEAIRGAGKSVEKNTAVYNVHARTIKEIEGNIALLNEELENTSSTAVAASINSLIKGWQKQADAIRGAGKAVEDNTPKFNAQASTLEEIEGNVAFFRTQLQKSTAQEAVAVNSSIGLWQKKADAIREAGSSVKFAFSDFKQGWSAAKGLASGVEGLTEALRGNSTWWEKIIAVVDGFIKIYEGIASVVGLIDKFTGASEMSAMAKQKEAVATAAATTAKVTDTAATVASTAATAADTAVTQQQTAADSAGAVAAATRSGAMLPFPANIAAIAAGVAAVVAALSTAAGAAALSTAAGAFAKGGVVGGSSYSGDRLTARVNSGEMILTRSQQSRLFALANGAAITLPREPRVEMPRETSLDRLRSLLAPGPQQAREVEFKIRGEYLVGLARKVISKKSRTNG